MLIILTAITEQGDIIVSANYTQEYLSDLKKHSTFTCLQCQEEVILKNGSINIPHFAHRRNTECTHSFSEGETEDHLNGKLQLFEFLQKQKANPQLEAFIPAIKQRPDILIRNDDSLIAIEFQCSSILPTTIEKRSIGYKQQNITPLWILKTPTISELPPQEIGFMQLSAFRQQFFVESPRNGKMIITYCPQTKYFHYISNPLHIKASKYIVKVKKLSLEHQSWPFAFVKRISLKEYGTYLRMYREQRFKHLNNLYFYNRKGVQSPFLQVCYKWQLYPKQLPIFIGIPSAYADSFHVHAVEWQIQFIDYLYALKIPIEQASKKHCESFLLIRPIGSNNSLFKLKAVESYLSILQQSLIKSEEVIYLTKFNISKMNHSLYCDFLAKCPEN